MPIDFPSSPTLNQVVTVNNKEYIWDGVKWVGKILNGPAGTVQLATLTDDTTTNATVYPVWVASGSNQPLKVSQSKLYFNPSTGLLVTDFLGAGSIQTGFINVDNITVDGNTISSVDADGNITLAPNGTGDVLLNADTVRVGDSNANATITTNGTGDLILNTNSGTSSGSITIADGTNGNITIGYVGSTGAVIFSNPTEATSSTDGSVEILGGAAIAKKLFVGGDITLSSGTPATSSGTLSFENGVLYWGAGVAVIATPLRKISGTSTSGTSGEFSLGMISSLGGGGGSTVTNVFLIIPRSISTGNTINTRTKDGSTQVAIGTAVAAPGPTLLVVTVSLSIPDYSITTYADGAQIQSTSTTNGALTLNVFYTGSGYTLYRII